MLDNMMVIPPITRHTQTVILLHGLYGKAQDFIEVPNILEDLSSKPYYPSHIPADAKKVEDPDRTEYVDNEYLSGVRWVFPNAPRMTLHWPDDMAHDFSGNVSNQTGKNFEYGVPAWYDYYTNCGGLACMDKINMTQWELMETFFHALVQRE